MISDNRFRKGMSKYKPRGRRDGLNERNCSGTEEVSGTQPVSLIVYQSVNQLSQNSISLFWPPVRSDIHFGVLPEIKILK